MLLSSSNQKYPPFPLLSHFSVVVCLRCLLHHNLSLIAYTFWENREFVFIIIGQFMMSAIFGYVLACRSYSFVCTVHHYHHCANLSEGIELKKNSLRYPLYNMWAVCFKFTHFSCDDWENIYTFSYYHHQIESMNYYPLFRIRSWNNGVRCMSFFILSYGTLYVPKPSLSEQVFPLKMISPCPTVANSSTNKCKWYRLRMEAIFCFKMWGSH